MTREPDFKSKYFMAKQVMPAGDFVGHPNNFTNFGDAASWVIRRRMTHPTLNYVIFAVEPVLDTREMET